MVCDSHLMYLFSLSDVLVQHDTRTTGVCVCARCDTTRLRKAEKYSPSIHQTSSQQQLYSFWVNLGALPFAFKIKVERVPSRTGNALINRTSIRYRRIRGSSLQKISGINKRNVLLFLEPFPTDGLYVGVLF